MAIDYNALALPKGKTRKQVKAKRTRAERQVVARVRAAVVERDGYCRAGKSDGFADCDGPSEWAHFSSHRRAKTRKQTAEQRHTTAGSLMLCRVHHRQYDAHRLDIVALTQSQGCNGSLMFVEVPNKSC